jgi:hypothetical protein
MPSAVVGFTSGGQVLYSGTAYSGRLVPVGGVQIVAHPSNSGNVYVALSGGVTVTSGGFPLSGGGLLDGIPLAAGSSYFVPKSALGASGFVNIWLASDAACSGQARVHWELI